MPRSTGLLTTVASRTPSFRRIRDGLVVHHDPSNVNSFPGVGTTIYDLSGFGIHGTKTIGLGHDQTRGYFVNTSFLAGAPTRYYSIPSTWSTLSVISGGRALTVAKANYANGLGFSLWYKMDAVNSTGTNTRTIFYGDCWSLSSTLNLATGIETFTVNFKYEIATLPRSNGTRILSSQNLKLVGTRTGIERPSWVSIVFSYDTATRTGVLYVNTVALATQIAVPKSTGNYDGNYHCPPWITVTGLAFGYSNSGSIFGPTYYFGKYGEFRMYKRSLDPDTILGIYEAAKNTYLGNSTINYKIPTTNLVLELSGNLLIDNISKQTGSIVGSNVTFVNTNKGYTYFADRTAGSKPPLDCIRYLNHLPANTLTNEITIHFWVKEPPTIQSGVWAGRPKSFSVFRFNGATAGAPGLWVVKTPIAGVYGSNTQIRYIVKLGTSEYSLLGINYGPNVWYCVTVVYRAGIGITFYLNGEEEFNRILGRSIYPVPNIDPIKPLLIGRSDKSFLDAGVSANSDIYTSGREFSLARLYIYNRALSDSEIWDLFNADKASFT